MRPDELAVDIIMEWSEADGAVVDGQYLPPYDHLAYLIKTAITAAIGAERRACYVIAFQCPTTSKPTRDVKAMIADQIACREFETVL